MMSSQEFSEERSRGSSYDERGAGDVMMAAETGQRHFGDG